LTGLVSGLFVGATRIDGKPVTKGMKLTQAKCDLVNAIERNKALVLTRTSGPADGATESWYRQLLPVQHRAGEMLLSTFYRKLNAGDRKGACSEIRR
jgi:GH24 family phage-related lysozyme (muramidase)